MDILAKSWTGPRVLVVEDDPVAAKVAKRLFAGQNVEVDLATDGRVALEMYRTNRYRLVLSDWLMPEINGVELCHEFRNLIGPYTYFLLCSAKGQKEDRMEAYNAGVDDFLNKPLDPQEFYARLTVARRILATEDALVAQNDALEETAVKLEESNGSLHLASRRFEELFNGLPVACFTFDENGFVHEWNRHAEIEFGFTPGTACQQPVWQVFREQAHSPWTKDRVRSIFGLESHPSFDWKLKRHGKDDSYYACNVIALRDRDNRPVGAVCTNLNITTRFLAEQRIEQQMEQINQYAEELEEANRKLNHLAVTDGLTGLWNHRRFKEMLDDSFESHVRSRRSFSLILLDIDHFKKFNDDLGHQTGDEVLRLIAERLRETARPHEQPSRYGGEEFAVLLQNCDVAAAKRAAQRILKSFRDLCICGRFITASFGISTWREGQGSSTNALVTQADKALYYSKQHGRNCATHWEDVSDELQQAA